MAEIAPTAKLDPMASQVSDRGVEANPKPWNLGAHGGPLSDPGTMDGDLSITIG
jgi:hypothetical protein